MDFILIHLIRSAFIAFHNNKQHRVAVTTLYRATRHRTSNDFSHQTKGNRIFFEIRTIQKSLKSKVKCVLYVVSTIFMTVAQPAKKITEKTIEK